VLAIVILAIVEGLTEFLPVSSTGHLVVAATLLGFDPAWREPFLVVIQLGAILAVVFDRRRQIARLFATGGTQPLFQFAIKLALGFFPSAVLGLLLHDLISGLLESPVMVSAAWIIGGVLILVLDRRPAEATPPGAGAAASAAAELERVSYKQAIAVGCAQCLALWPGMSRSGSTILGGLAAGLDRSTATLFSFYLAIPTMFAASGYELLKYRDRLDGSGAAFAVGMIGSFAVALATVRWLLRFVQTHTFRGFAIYRIAAGALLLLLPATWVEG
jgi:undecaprenyl-diphosphatase